MLNDRETLVAMFTSAMIGFTETEDSLELDFGSGVIAYFRFNANQILFDFVVKRESE